MASAHRAADGRRLRHGGDHAPRGHQQDGSLALAGAVYDRGGRRLAARQDPPVAHPALSTAVEQGVVARTLLDPPGETTHWTATAMARESGISISSVHRIWRRHGLRPHRVRQFKLSNDRQFASKLRDIVGLYVDPPAHAVVLSIDEKSQIQALDRTQPGLPMKKGRCGTMTHDYKRHGTTTLFAALNVLDGKVIGRCMQRHRHQEFIRFLNAVEANVPAGKLIHAIADNLCDAQASQGATVARPTSALDIPLHANLHLVVERGRGLLCQTDQAAAQTWRVPFNRRAPGRHQPLPPRDQRTTTPLPLDQGTQTKSSPPSKEGSKC